MNEWIIGHEPWLRVASFLGVLGMMAGWEELSPSRRLTIPKAMRWMNNLGITLFNSLALRVLFPGAATGVAAYAIAHGWGFIHLLAWPGWLTAIVSVILLDLVIYLQHVMMHFFPVLWRLHRVHHADPDFDVTTGARFHPIEIVISMLIKFAAVLMIGPPVLAVILFEILLNASALFNHGNVNLPAGIDRALRLLIVTPDMHRVHHSVENDETNSNFGFFLSCWDRLFGTYLAQPRKEQEAMVIGIPEFRRVQDVSSITAMLALPFRQERSSV